MSTAIAYNNSYAHIEEQQETLAEKIQRYWKLQERYDGLFNATQAMLLLQITNARFHLIKDRLEKVELKEFEGREFYTGRSLLKYRSESVKEIKNRGYKK